MQEEPSDKKFIEDLIALIDGASVAIDSAHMSEEFLASLDKSLGEIPNMADLTNSAEKHANSSNTP